jgi:hypothetical protein
MRCYKPALNNDAPTPDCKRWLLKHQGCSNKPACKPRSPGQQKKSSEQKMHRLQFWQHKNITGTEDLGHLGEMSCAAEQKHINANTISQTTADGRECVRWGPVYTWTWQVSCAVEPKTHQQMRPTATGPSIPLTLYSHAQPVRHQLARVQQSHLLTKAHVAPRTWALNTTVLTANPLRCCQEAAAAADIILPRTKAEKIQAVAD